MKTADRILKSSLHSNFSHSGQSKTKSVAEKSSASHEPESSANENVAASLKDRPVELNENITSKMFGELCFTV